MLICYRTDCRGLKFQDYLDHQATDTVIKHRKVFKKRSLGDTNTWVGDNEALDKRQRTTTRSQQDYIHLL